MGTFENCTRPDKNIMAGGGEHHHDQTARNTSQQMDSSSGLTSTDFEVSGVKRRQEQSKGQKRLKRIDEIQDSLTGKVVEGGYGYQRARYITENAFPKAVEDLRFAAASYGESREAMVEQGVDMSGVPEKLDLDHSKLVRIYSSWSVQMRNNEKYS